MFTYKIKIFLYINAYFMRYSENKVSSFFPKISPKNESFSMNINDRRLAFSPFDTETKGDILQ